MTDRDQIIEAMAAAIRRERERPAIRSLEWSQKAPERMATAALDAALPLMRRALAEMVWAEMSTSTVAREFIAAARTDVPALVAALRAVWEFAARERGTILAQDVLDIITEALGVEL